jgi:hypothetical protein
MSVLCPNETLQLTGVQFRSFRDIKSLLRPRQLTLPLSGRGRTHEEVSMRRIRYSVAMSLDGYIAGPNGEGDWIIMDPDIDFGELMNSFDTVLMGRRTFEAAQSSGKDGSMPGMRTFPPEG